VNYYFGSGLLILVIVGVLIWAGIGSKRTND